MIGSLFSGVGGLELGLEMAGLGPVAWQVEQSEFCRQVLAQHWPDAERFEDVRTCERLPTVDVLCGGFPCQDLSVAGKQAGLGGKRSGLWYEMLRIVEANKPTWVVIENVAHKWRSWVPHVRRDLAGAGYASLPLRVQAADVGAWHERARVFVVAANIDRIDLRKQPRGGWGACWSRSILAARAGAPWAPADVDGDGELQPTWTISEERGRVADGAPAEGAPADADCERGKEGRANTQVQGRLRNADWQRIHTGRPDAIEPLLVRGVHGVPRRMDRVTALGNCVVPQCACAVGLLIAEHRERGE